LFLSNLKKNELIKKYGNSILNTGSTEVQIVLLTYRIKYLTNHLKIYRKDVHSKHGLLNMASKRKRLIKYLKKRDTNKYESLLTQLHLRKKNY
jgi:small subunit ribosomal protein S15